MRVQIIILVIFIFIVVIVEILSSSQVSRSFSILSLRRVFMLFFLTILPYVSALYLIMILSLHIVAGYGGM